MLTAQGQKQRVLSEQTLFQEAVQQCHQIFFISPLLYFSTRGLT